MISFTKREIRVVFGSILLIGILYIISHGWELPVNPSKKSSMKEELMEFMESGLDDGLDYSMIDGETVGGSPHEDNYYPDSYHTSSVVPEKTDLSQYFKQTNAPNEIDLVKDIQVSSNLNNMLVKEQQGQGSMWNYDNENVMNGGQFMGSITGNDKDDTFASF